ncbi:MAG: hypothetical protein LBN05_07030 [Oscillospiraceae bacterium]|nr:hypothetical protein [Oscillospiraceae bacterium]
MATTSPTSPTTPTVSSTKPAFTPPKTGDDTNSTLWFALMIGSAFVLRWLLFGQAFKRKETP